MMEMLKRLCAACALLGLVGCATWRAPTEPADAEHRARAVTESTQDVRLSAAVLSVEDSERMFGADIQATGVQPVWVEVVNDTRQPLWLLRPGVDPDYFSPLEVAWSLHTVLGRDTNDEIDDHFDRLGFRNPIVPGETHSGVVFTNPSRNTKLLNVDLLGKQKLVPFTLLLPVPDQDSKLQAAQSAWQDLDGHGTDYRDLASLRIALEALPCCGASAEGATATAPPSTSCSLAASPTSALRSCGATTGTMCARRTWSSRFSGTPRLLCCASTRRQAHPRHG